MSPKIKSKGKNVTFSLKNRIPKKEKIKFLLENRYFIAKVREDWKYKYDGRKIFPIFLPSYFSFLIHTLLCYPSLLSCYV